MGPDTFEQHIREKIQKREISPSEEAWKRIAEQVPQEAERGRSIFWYGIAASFAGLVIGALCFMQLQNEDTNVPVKVVEAGPETSTDNNQRDKWPVMDTPMTKESFTMTPVPESQEKVEIEKNRPGVQRALALANAEHNPEEQEGLKEEPVPRTGSTGLETDQIIEAKITEVVAEVRLLETSNEALTEAEVDSLLRRAQSELLRERLFKNGRSVDAVALLNEVEEELDQSFRDQLFERLKAGFMKVRTALADRNN